MATVRVGDRIRLARQDIRERQILEAAARVIVKKGFRAARMQEIADAAGVANGTVYNYFRSKDALLLALLDRLNESEDRPAQLDRLSQGDRRRTFAALMQHRFDVLSGKKPLLRALLPEVIDDRRLRQRYFRRVIGPTFALAEKTFAQQGYPNPAHFTRAMAASLFGLVLLDLLGDARSGEDAPEIIALLGEAFAGVAGTAGEKGAGA